MGINSVQMAQMKHFKVHVQQAVELVHEQNIIVRAVWKVTRFGHPMKYNTFKLSHLIIILVLFYKIQKKLTTVS